MERPNPGTVEILVIPTKRFANSKYKVEINKWALRLVLQYINKKYQFSVAYIRANIPQCKVPSNAQMLFSIHK